MKLMYAFVLAGLLVACSRTSKQDDLHVTCPAPTTIPWLAEKQKEYSSCYCLTGMRQGIFKDQPIIEIYLYDPVCDGINVVYKIDGTPWFNSSEPVYAEYTAQVTDRYIFWTCKGGNL